MSGKILRQFITEHWGKILGGVIGLLIGLTILLFGFWRSMLLFACITLGVFVGSRLFDRHDGLQGLLQRFWPDSD